MVCPSFFLSKPKLLRIISATAVFYIKYEQAVSRVLSCVTIYLGHMLPHGSSDYKELGGSPLNAPNSILLQVGFTERTSRHAVGELLPRLSTLTPLLICKKAWRYISVALSLESPPPVVSRHLYPVKLGLSSCTFSAHAITIAYSYI